MTIYDRSFGRYLEDFVPGDVYRHWPGKTVTAADGPDWESLARAGGTLVILIHRRGPGGKPGADPPGAGHTVCLASHH